MAEPVTRDFPGERDRDRRDVPSRRQCVSLALNGERDLDRQRRGPSLRLLLYLGERDRFPSFSLPNGVVRRGRYLGSSIP